MSHKQINLFSEKGILLDNCLGTWPVLCRDLAEVTREKWEVSMGFRWESYDVDVDWNMISMFVLSYDVDWGL